MTDGSLDRPRASGRTAFFRRPIIFRYGRSLFLDAMVRALIALATVEAIFLSDVVVSYLLPRVLEHDAGFLNLAVLVGLALPEVLAIALPLILLIATYLTVVRRREAREFITVAGAGYGVHTLVTLASLIGLCGLSFSLLITCYAEPHSRYLTRKTLFDIVHGTLRDGELSPAKFYEIGDLVVFAASGRIANVARNTFTHQRQSDSQFRVIVASKTARMDFVERSRPGLMLENAAIYEFETNMTANGKAREAEMGTCAGCDAFRDTSSLKVMRSERLFVEMPSAQLPYLGPRGESIEERTAFELLSSDAAVATAASTLGVRLQRSFLCFLVPLLAVLAAQLTTPKTSLVALPAAALAVLMVSFFSPYAMSIISSAGMSGTLVFVVAWSAIAALILVRLIRRFEAGCVNPTGVRL
jgi:lipopolysaccharide export LptBFGC system permease protein LptF